MPEVSQKRKEFDLQEFLYSLTSTAALAFAVFIAMWVIAYFNETMKNAMLTNLNAFLASSWIVIVGFVLIVSVWEYFYPIYYDKMKYGRPAMLAIEFLFGFWLVAVFLDGLRAFVAPTDQVNIFLTFPFKLFNEQFVMVALLLLFIHYARFFLRKKYQEE
ncbi:MAG: hypothetical protein AABW59_04730 [archaeon]